MLFSVGICGFGLFVMFSMFEDAGLINWNSIRAGSAVLTDAILVPISNRCWPTDIVVRDDV